MMEKDEIVVNAYCNYNIQEKRINHNNFGDDLNFLFLQKVMNKIFIPNSMINHPYFKPPKHDTEYCFIGSILSQYATPKSIVWGSGIIRDKDRIYSRPKEILAVRGPLTRQKLLDNGIDCPEVYGDPALLLPLHYYPSIERRYKYGIIPHFNSLDDRALNKFKNNENIKIINFRQYTSYQDVIDEMLSCEFIFSESLHGLIISEAYNIPSKWIDISLEKREKSNFKFHDYFLSQGYDIEKAIDFNGLNISDLELIAKQPYHNHYNLDINKLISACPFELRL